jgi:hypothetical protein
VGGFHDRRFAALRGHRQPQGTPPRAAEVADAGGQRITFGCINVPNAFYKEVVSPLLTDTSGVV